MSLCIRSAFLRDCLVSFRPSLATLIRQYGVLDQDGLPQLQFQTRTHPWNGIVCRHNISISILLSSFSLVWAWLHLQEHVYLTSTKHFNVRFQFWYSALLSCDLICSRTAFWFPTKLGKWKNISTLMAGFKLYPILVIHHRYKSICPPDSSYEMWPLILYITYQNVSTRSIQYKRC